MDDGLPAASSPLFNGGRVTSHNSVGLFGRHCSDVLVGSLDGIGALLAVFPHLGGLRLQHVGLVLHGIGLSVGCVFNTIGQVLRRTLAACGEGQGT